MVYRKEQIAERAYRIWEDAGRPEGCDIEHWLRAEAELAEAGTAAEGATEPAHPAAPAHAEPDAAPAQRRELAA